MSRFHGLWSVAGGSALGLCASLTLAANAPDASTAPTDELQEVVVTGSRVITNGDDSPTPLTVVSAQTLQDTMPGPIANAVMRLPEFGIGHSPTTNPANSGQQTSGMILNLRNMGTTRNLIMFDNRRVTPTSTVYEADASFVPSMLLQRVDIVTGGASAVYGSDAVTGVVNFVTDRNFNGFKVDARYGLSTYGDGQETSLGFAGGTSLFDGRAHIEGSYEWLDNPGIVGCGGRDFCENAYTIYGAGTAANPYKLIKNTRLSSTSFNGLIPNYTATANVGNPLRGSEFSNNGVLVPFQNGVATSTAGVQSGGDGGWYNQSSTEAQLATHQAFGRFDFDVTDSTHFSAEVTGSLVHNFDQTQWNEVRNITLSTANAFLAPQYQTLMTGAGLTKFTFSKMFTDIPALDSQSWTRHYMADFTLNGKLGDYKWELFYHPDYSTQNTRNDNNISNQRLAAAEDAVVDPLTGQTVCNVTLTNPGLYTGCVPLNMFGPNSEGRAAIDYISQQTQFTATYKAHDGGASISGQPLSTWAGPVSAALSTEWRYLAYSVDAEGQPLAANCTGLRYNCGASTLQYAGNTLASLSQVSQSVAEGAIEADVPLISNIPAFQSLDFNGAYRYTYYNTSGSANTWKLGLTWKVNDQLTLRGTRSRDIRAPSVIDLFAPPLYTVGGSNLDKHTNVVSTGPMITYSNRDLKPEVGQDITAGFIIHPSFLPNFSVSVDFFSITINGAIVGVSGASPNIQNACIASGGTSPLCDLAVRPNPWSDSSAANTATAWLTEPENALQQKAYGADFELSYSTRFLGGQLSLRSLTNYEPHATTQLPGQAPTDTAGAAYGACCQLFGIPRVQSTFLTTYQRGNYSVDLEERFQTGLDWNADRTLVFDTPGLPARFYTDLTLAYQFSHAQAYVSARNLFNEAPDLYGRTTGAPGVGGGYVNGQDTIGAFFSVGVHYKL